MCDIKGDGSGPFRHIVACGFLTLLSAAAYGASLNLPDAVRPGAVRPEEVGRPVIPTHPGGELFDVPAVIDRPFEIDEGPKVSISRFNLTDAHELPRFGVNIKDIEQILEQQIQRYPQGFTIGQIQEVADLVTQYYRERGLILAKAVVPVQTIGNDGIVRIQVLEGRLGRVLTEGNVIYSQALLTRPFAQQLGHPVTKEGIEEALLTLSDFPGLSVFGVFQPGQQVGEADIVLTIQEEERVDMSLRVDNHGLQETGRIRIRPMLEWNNPTGSADRLTFTYQPTFHPRNNHFVAVDYERYLGRGFRTGAFYYLNRFDVGGELAAQQIFGESYNLGLFMDKSWVRSRQMNLSSRLGFTRKESRTEVRDNLSNLDQLSVLSLQANFDNVDIRTRGINFLSIELSRGIEDFAGSMGSAADARLLPSGSRPSRQGGPPRRDFASGKFKKVFIRGSRLQTVKSDLTLLLRGEYLWTTDILVPIEQYSVGGADNVRAFPQAQQLLDRALFFSAELIHNIPFVTDRIAFGNRTWGELVQISTFYDHATGKLNHPLASEPQGYINFKGAGAQLRFTLPGSIESRLICAWEVGSSKADNGRSPQLWADITLRF